MQSAATDLLPAYEALLHQYLDGRPVPPSTQKSSVAERDRAFFCHPLWEAAPREAFEHELFAVAYQRYFRQEAVSNTALLKRVATLAPDALMRAVRYAQLFLNLESPRWREVLELKPTGFGGLRDFIKVQEIINTEYRRLNAEVQRAEHAVKDFTILETLLYASLYGFQSLLPERVRINRLLRDIRDGSAAPPGLLDQTLAASEAYDQRYTLATGAMRAQKAQALINWTACERYPQDDLATSRAVLEFLTLDLRAWAARLRADSRVDLPELYERPYLQLGEYLVQIPWLGAFRHTTNAAINQLRLTSPRRPGLRDETRAIEEQIGQLLHARGFRVVLNYHPLRRDGEDDAGEVDVICQRDGHLFVIEVKSTYVRKDFREAWQHKYQTLRRAGLQVTRKCAALCQALRTDSDLRSRLGLRQQEVEPTLHGWIVDTCIEHDHENFSGHLKVSLEELLVVLQNERHLLLGMAGEPEEADLYPDGFSGDRFAAIIEGNELWSMLTSTGHGGDPAPGTGV